MDYDFKWIRPNMSLYHIDKNSPFPITLLNSGNLADDFNKYAEDFFNAAESVIHYLGEDAAENGDIEKLDLWYFAMVYLYRQSMELLLKANIFKIVTAENDRKLIIGDIRHDLKQGYDKLLELKDLEYTDNDNANWLWKYLADISRIDKESYMFRYPFGNNLNVLFDKQTHISLAATHDNMNKAFNILSELYKTGNFTEQEYEAYSPQLIIEGGHYYQQSVVGYKYAQHSFYPYYSSYEEVGNFLKEKIVDDNKKELFMPMCYMYRNAVELGLKRFELKDGREAILRSPKEEDVESTLEYLVTSAGETDYILRYPEECGKYTAEGEKTLFEQKNASPNEAMIMCIVEGKVVGNCEISFFKGMKTKHRASISIALISNFWN